MAFNPTLETNPQPLQSVAPRPTAVGALVGLFDNLGAFNQKEAPSQSDVRARDDRNFFTTMDSINQQVASGQITAEQGQVAYRNTYRGYTSIYGVGSNPEADKLFSANTGMDPMIATTGNSNNNDYLRQDENYGLGYQLALTQNPQASPAELDEYAVNYAATQKATKAALESAKNNTELSWVQRQPAYDSAWLQVTDKFQRLAAAAEADGIIEPAEGEELRRYVRNEMGQFQQPIGVDSATWKSYIDNKMSSMLALTGANIEAAVKGNFDSDAKKVFANLYAMAAVKGGLSPTMIYTLERAQGDQGEALKLLSQLDQNESGLGEANRILKMSYQELKDYALNFEYQDATFLDRVDTTDWKQAPDDEKVDSMMSADLPMLTSGDNTTVLIAVTNIVEKVAALDNQRVDGPLINRLFGPAFFSAVTRLNQQNPTIGAALIERTNTALSQQQTAFKVHVQEIARQNGFTAREVTGPDGTTTIDFFPDPALINPQAKWELDTFFGGDWNRAQSANGTAIQGRSNLSPNLTRMFSEMSKVNGELAIFNKIETARATLNGQLPKPVEQPTTQKPVEENLGVNIPEEVRNDTGFISAVKSTSSALGIQPDWLLRVIDFETASTWSPAIKNPGSTATGLIQFMESTAANLGTSTAELKAMSREQQMVFVQKYLEPFKGRMNNIGDVYMAVHWPAAVGKDDNYVMYQRGSDEYSANRNLDVNDDGIVTKGEAVARVMGTTGKGNLLPYVDHNTGTSATGPAPDTRGPMNWQDTVYDATPLATPNLPQPQASTQAPAAMAAPEEMAAGVKITDPTKVTPTAALDPAIQEFIDGLKKGRMEFNSEEELNAAISAGKVKKGDIVFVAGRPREVK